MKKIALLMSLAICLIAAPAVSSQSITNGSFEDGNSGCSGWTTVNTGGTSITGWTVTGGSVDHICSYWEASNGDRSIDLSGLFAAGEISQTLATTAGVNYLVTFDISGNPDGGQAQKDMSVSASGAPTAFYQYLVTAQNSSQNMLWNAETYSFMATGPSTTLTFASEEAANDAYGPALDNVAIAAVSATVCHRNNGRSGSKTLTVGVNALSAHLAHGDTAGPCPTS